MDGRAVALCVCICVHLIAVENLHFILENQLFEERFTEKDTYAFPQIMKQKIAKTFKLKT